jgi:hypothetical protein
MVLDSPPHESTQNAQGSNQKPFRAPDMAPNHAAVTVPEKLTLRGPNLKGRKSRKLGIKSGSAALTAAVASASRIPAPVPSTTAVFSGSRPAYAPLVNFNDGRFGQLPNGPTTSTSFGENQLNHGMSVDQVPNHSPTLNQNHESSATPNSRLPHDPRPMVMPGDVHRKESTTSLSHLSSSGKPPAECQWTRSRPPKPGKRTLNAPYIYTKEDMSALSRVRSLFRGDCFTAEQKRALLAYVDGADSSAYVGREQLLDLAPALRSATVTPADNNNSSNH